MISASHPTADKLGRDEKVQQRNILQITATVLSEEVAQQGATRLYTGFKPDEAHAALG
jgi:hypothetical protein